MRTLRGLSTAEKLACSPAGRCVGQIDGTDVTAPMNEATARAWLIEPKAEAIRDFEQAVAVIALVFGDSLIRDIAIKARGNIREAFGEART